MVAAVAVAFGGGCGGGSCGGCEYPCSMQLFYDISVPGAACQASCENKQCRPSTVDSTVNRDLDSAAL